MAYLVVFEISKTRFVVALSMVEMLSFKEFNVRLGKEEIPCKMIHCQSVSRSVFEGCKPIVNSAGFATQVLEYVSGSSRC